MKISMMAAMAENRIIGTDGDLPWHMPNDLKRFKEVTRGHHIIMGRKTFESLGGKPLPKRTNIILSKKEDYQPENTFVVDSIEKALEIAMKNKDPEPFIIGGGTIYKQALHLADRIYLTVIDTEVEGDTYFPELKENEWEVVNKEDFPSDEKHKYAYSFFTYERKNQR